MDIRNDSVYMAYRVKSKYLHNLAYYLEEKGESRKIIKRIYEIEKAINDLVERLEFLERDLEWKEKVVEAAERRFIIAENELNKAIADVEELRGQKDE